MRLRAVLFPNRLGMPDLTNESVDYYVGHTLDVTLRELMVQVRRELRFAGDATRPAIKEAGSGNYASLCPKAAAYTQFA